MNKVLSLLAIAVALACGACAPAAGTSSGSTSNDQVFPSSLQFQQPEGVK